MVIIIPILAVLGAIWGGITGAVSQVLSILQSIVTALWQMIRTFIDVAPTALKVLVFMFLLVTVGNIFSNFFMGASYACDSANLLYQAPDMLTGIIAGIRMNFLAFTIGERDSFIQSNYQQKAMQSGFTTVRCASEQPKLFFYNIEILSYRLWLLMLLLIYGAPMAFKWYQKMGVLG